MKQKNRWLTMMLGGLLIAAIGTVGIIAATMLGTRGPVVVSAAPSQSAPQVAQQAPVQGTAATIEGAYSGAVALTWVAGGVYSDTLVIPQPEEMTVTLELGAIDLALQLSQNNHTVSGYVDLGKTLIFSVEHTLNDGTQTGPSVSGAFDGTNLTLASERFTTVIDGKPIARQFRLTGQIDATNKAVVRGEYRETFWGYTEQPSTVIGDFTLQRPVFDNRVPDTTNKAPLTVVDSVSTEKGTAITINVLANDSDPNGDALTISDVSKPQFGVATTDGQRITYTPNADFEGEDRFTYLVVDGKGGEAASSVTVHVGKPNGLPTADADSATTQQDTAVTIDVASNDSDPDGDPLTITIDQQPANGTAIVENGKIIYTPNAGFVGMDTFTYIVADGKGGTATATVTVTVAGGDPDSSHSLYLPIVQR